MRIRWRGLELPSHIARDEAVNTDSYGRFTIEPFEQGFGTTIGNSLRRVLLSSLEGAAITSVKIAGVAHEFATIAGVMEDVTDVILNVKGVVLRMEDPGPKTLRVRRDEAGEVRAGNFECDPSIMIINKDHLIATLSSDVPFEVQMSAQRGRGYASANENRSPDAELGVIPIDSVFSPILRVRYRTENMRVGQRTNYDRLIMEIWTNGTITPEDALVEAGMILRKHLGPFVMFNELGESQVTRVTPRAEAVQPTPRSRDDLLDKPISVLNLSVRASNCLEAAKVKTVGDLVSLTESELLRFRSFGKTSLHEVQRRLTDAGLSLASEDDHGVPGGSEKARLESTSFASSDESGPMEAYTMPDSVHSNNASGS